MTAPAQQVQISDTFKDLISYVGSKPYFSHGDDLLLTHADGSTFRCIFQSAILKIFNLKKVGENTWYQASLKDPTLVEITHVATNRIFRRTDQS